jgi:hypothetical protein
LGHRELTEKDLSVDEKKVFGRIIDMWAAGDPADPYASSTESKLIKHSKKDGFPDELIVKIVKDLAARGLINLVNERGETFIKFRVEASHIVKELQKTQYVYLARDFKPPHR